MHDLLPGFLLLAAASLFATVFAAFTVSGDAGLTRLEEKFPDVAPRIRAWAPRWDRLRGALLVAAILLEMAAIYRFGRLGGNAPTAARVAAWTIGVPAFAFLLRTLPQVLSETYADRISVRSLASVTVLGLVLAPVAGPLAAVERRLRRALRAGADERDRPTAEDAIISLVDQTPDEHLDTEEREIIRSVFEFGSTVAREIMTPRVRMQAFEAATPVADILDSIRESGYSRYPVYEERVDQVVGVAHARDLLLAAAEGHADRPVRALMQRPAFVPETMPISDLLKLLRARRHHLAVVVDEYGGTAGLVTMEDVLEELIGEIRDEFDDDEVDLQPTTASSVVVDASLAVDELNEAFGLSIPDADHYDSLGGYVVSELGHIPPPGAVVEKESFRMTVEDANERQVLRIRIERRDRGEGPAA